MKTKIRIMRPGEPDEEREVEIDDKRIYLSLCAIVEPLVGGLMEHVRVFARFVEDAPYRYMDMFVNETGRLDGLPRNEAATAVYRHNVLVHEAGIRDPETLDWIAGPAVLFDKEVWR